MSLLATEMEREGVALAMVPLTTPPLTQRNRARTVQKRHPHEHSKRSYPPSSSLWCNAVLTHAPVPPRKENNERVPSLRELTRDYRSAKTLAFLWSSGSQPCRLFWNPSPSQKATLPTTLFSKDDVWRHRQKWQPRSL